MFSVTLWVQPPEEWGEDAPKRLRELDHRLMCQRSFTANFPGRSSGALPRSSTDGLYPVRVQFVLESSVTRARAFLLRAGLNVVDQTSGELDESHGRPVHRSLVAV